MSCAGLLAAGWYCVGCEQYKDDGEMAPGNVCPLHRAPCVERREENYFFALSRYQRQIEARPQPGQPALPASDKIVSHHVRAI